MGTEKLGGISLNGYSIVGDGTTANVGGVLTGWNELKSGTQGYPLYEGRKGFPGAKTLDDWPWIMNDFKKAGFVTAGHLGDSSNILPFGMRLRGLKTSQFDHDISPYFYHGEHMGNCNVGLHRSEVVLNFVNSFLKAYN